MASTKELDTPTRTRLLDAAQELMMAKGFVATTVDEVCAAAGVTKGSFFHYFESKEALAKVLLARFSAAHFARFSEACGAIADPLERVYAMIDTAIALSRSPETKGCLVGTFAQEISETHPDLRDICARSLEAFGGAVGRDLAEAKRIHAPKADFDPASLGEYFVALGQGALLVFKTTGDRTGPGRHFEHFKRYLRSLFGR